MLVFPIAVDVPMSRWPWMNWVVMGGIVLCFLVQQVAPEATVGFIYGIDRLPMEMLGPPIDEHPLSIIGHMFLHADIWHLAGNMLFMWVFGNAVCARVGNLWYPLLFIAWGMVAGFTEHMVSDWPLLGSSGAICGVTGFYLVFYPVNEISVFYFFWIIVRVLTGTFEVAGYWVVVAYVALDAFGVLVSPGNDIAYLAHLGGYAAGSLTAVALLVTRVLEPTDHEQTLLSIRGTRSPGTPAARRRGPAMHRPQPRTDERDLLVHMGNGEVERVSVTDIVRRGVVGPDGEDTLVSEDGKSWMTYGQWRDR